MQRDRDLDSWAVFCRVAETGSISEACEILNMDASAVSRIIRGLEESLGKVPLFDRSMRPLKLTKNGEIALGYAREMLEGHRALRESLQRDPNAMAGTIHIGLPPLLLHNFLLPLIIDFHNRFPEIYLKINEHIGSTPLNFDTPKGRLDIMMG